MIFTSPPAYYGLFSPSQLAMLSTPLRLLWSASPRLICSVHPPAYYGLFSPLPHLIMVCSPSAPTQLAMLCTPHPLLIMVCTSPQLVMVCSAPSPHPACYGLFTGGWSKMAAVGPKSTANRFRSPKKPRVQSFSSTHKRLSEF